LCERGEAGADRGGAGALRILALVSGNGTNLQALIDAERAGRFRTPEGAGTLSLVISDRPGAYALERAKAAGIPALALASEEGASKAARRRELSGRLLRAARERGVGLIILAGFLPILEGGIVNEYAGRIINLHPALLPKYGGEGMYGARVHRAVLAAGEAESGCTVHLVDAGTDTGPILLQRRVPVLDGDTAEALAERVRREEHAAITEAAVMMIRRLADKKAYVYGDCHREGI
jgi:phosphoribosylglycinamide formyltransferase-1